MHTAFLPEIPAVGTPVRLDRREEEHLFRILRCRDGETVRLCDGRGVSALAEAAQRTLIVRERTIHRRDPVRIHLYAAQPKSARLEDVLKPAAEAGAVSITPLLCRYSVAHRERASERWRKLLIEGCKQSGNPFLPELCPEHSVGEALAEIAAARRKAFFGKPGGVLWDASDLVPDADGRVELAWLVGPEGGFTPEEERLLEAHGALGIALGPYIMRLETAALAGMVYLGQTARRGIGESGK